MAKQKKKTLIKSNGIKIERIQTGIRIEKRILKILKALSEHFDLTLGDMLEGIVLHAFEGKVVFDQETIKVINTLKEIYKLDFDSSASHSLYEDK